MVTTSCNVHWSTSDSHSYYGIRAGPSLFSFHLASTSLLFVLWLQGSIVSCLISFGALILYCLLLRYALKVFVEMSQWKLVGFYLFFLLEFYFAMFLCQILELLASESNQVISIKLDGANYFYWSYLLRRFLIGKKLWRYVDGTIKALNSKITEFSKFKIKITYV